MSSISLPLALAAAYLVAWALVSEVVERHSRLSALATHPVVFGLALGVYATAWTLYGSVGYGVRYGYGFLAISLGVVLSCLLIPVLWEPLARLVKQQGLTSVADLFAFRYQSQSAGALVTLFMVAGLLPYIALQMRAISDAALVLAGDGAFDGLGLRYGVLLGLFAAGLGVRYADPRSQRPGLLATLAIETVVKTVALGVVGVAALFGVFGGWGGLESHLAEHPELLQQVFDPVGDGPWNTFLMISFVAAFLLPRQFHVAFVELPNLRALRTAAWVLPLVLLLLNLPLPILYWAGLETVPHTSPDQWVLRVANAAHSPGLMLVAFLGGVSASSAMVLVTSIALSGMVVNHVFLPLRRYYRGLDGEGLVQLRRAVIAGIVASGFFLQVVLPRHGRLVDLGLVSFTAVLQVVPGVFGTLFWPRATRRGILLGLVAGAGAWALVTAAPLLGIMEPSELPRRIGVGDLDPRSSVVWITLGFNAVAFFLGSLSERPRRQEQAAALAAVDAGGAGVARRPPSSIDWLRERVARVLDPESATDELARALRALELTSDERRPLQLLRVAEQLENQLSSLIGPLAASRVLRGHDVAPRELAVELSFLAQRAQAREAREASIERSFEIVRRYLTGVLERLPLGVCGLDENRRVILWNEALQELSGVAPDEVIGGDLADVPAPWFEVLGQACASQELAYDVTLGERGRERALQIRRAHLGEGDGPGDGQGGCVLLVEDETEQRALWAQVAHQNRLATMGRVAAGVAHEVGNPLAGLLMVARNLERDIAEGELERPEAASDVSSRLATIVEQARRIDGIVRSLLGFTRAGEPLASRRRLAPIALDELCHEAVALVRLSPQARDLSVRMEVPSLRVSGDRQRLEQVVVNLLTNARDVTPAGGSITLRAEEDEHGVRLEVWDEGPGIDPELVEKVFEPFFTTKDPGEGTGLGLALAYRIVEDHGGHLGLRAAPGGGTIFRVELPKASEETR